MSLQAGGRAAGRAAAERVDRQAARRPPAALAPAPSQLAAARTARAVPEPSACQLSSSSRRLGALLGPRLLARPARQCAFQATCLFPSYLLAGDGGRRQSLRPNGRCNCAPWPTLRSFEAFCSSAGRRALARPPRPSSSRGSWATSPWRCGSLALLPLCCCVGLCWVGYSSGSPAALCCAALRWVCCAGRAVLHLVCCAVLCMLGRASLLGGSPVAPAVQELALRARAAQPLLPCMGRATAAAAGQQPLGQRLLTNLHALRPPPCVQVNASDTRGKADAAVVKGVGGKLANAVKELSTNAAISYDARGQRKKVGAVRGAGHPSQLCAAEAAPKRAKYAPRSGPGLQFCRPVGVCLSA